MRLSSDHGVQQAASKWSRRPCSVDWRRLAVTLSATYDTGTHSQWVMWRCMYFIHARGVTLYILRWVGVTSECRCLSQHSQCRMQTVLHISVLWSTKKVSYTWTLLVYMLGFLLLHRQNHTHYVYSHCFCIYTSGHGYVLEPIAIQCAVI